jgi:tetratricopeptide (TPR) repeat protein
MATSNMDSIGKCSDAAHLLRVQLAPSGSEKSGLLLSDPSNKNGVKADTINAPSKDLFKLADKLGATPCTGEKTQTGYALYLGFSDGAAATKALKGYDLQSTSDPIDDTALIPIDSFPSDSMAITSLLNVLRSSHLQNPDAWIVLVQLYAKMEDFTHAIAAARNAVHFGDDDPKYMESLADVLYDDYAIGSTRKNRLDSLKEANSIIKELVESSTTPSGSLLTKYAETLLELSRHEIDNGPYLDKALDALNRAAAAGMNSVIFHRTLGIVQFKRGEFEEAKLSLSKAYSMNTNNFEVKRFLALTKIELGDHAGGIALLKEMIESTPMDPAAYKDLGVALIGMQEFIGARDALDKARELYGDSVPEIVLMMWEYVKNVIVAARFQGDTTREPPDPVDMASMNYQDFSRTGNIRSLNRAITILEIASETEESSELHVNHGAMLLELVQTMEDDSPERDNVLYKAIESLNSAFGFGEMETEVLWMAYRSLGFAYHELGKLDEAETAYYEALTLDSKNMEIRHRLGKLYLERQRVEEARDIFIDIIEEDPTSAGAHANLGTAYLTMGDYELAREALERADKLLEGRTPVGILNTLVLTAMHLQDYDMAIGALTRILKIDEENPNTWRRLGDVYVKVNSPRAALEAYSRALEIDPEDHKASYGIGMALNKLGENPEEALKHLEPALMEFPYNIEVITETARAAYAAGDWNRAITLAWSAVSIDRTKGELLRSIATELRNQQIPEGEFMALKKLALLELATESEIKRIAELTMASVGVMVPDQINPIAIGGTPMDSPNFGGFFEVELVRVSGEDESSTTGLIFSRHMIESDTADPWAIPDLDALMNLGQWAVGAAAAVGFTPPAGNGTPTLH